MSIEKREKIDAIDLKRLCDLSDDDCDALCQYCFDYLSGNTLCQSSKSFLDGNKALIQKILSLIYRSIKYETEEEIQSLLVQFSANFKKKFLDHYRSNHDKIRSLMIDQAVANHFDLFYQLRWRFEIKLASKYCRDQFQPYIILSFFVKTPQKNMKRIDIKCSLFDVYHICQKLSDLIEINNSTRCTRLVKIS
ncbi:hypothetical protein SSS_10365 [Sarcoptes scabiei]|nr:hypothetical protein SSS_10365 [Sarcoptes scabiei]